MTRRGLMLVAFLVAVSGCGGEEPIRIESAVPRQPDDRVIDVFTTNACGVVRVEVDENEDTVTLRAYDDRPGDACAGPQGVADLATPLAGRTIIDGSRRVALDTP